MPNCVQCSAEADIHVSWLGVHNKPQDGNFCSHCMKTLIEKYKGSQFSQTLIIKPVQHLGMMEESEDNIWQSQ